MSIPTVINDQMSPPTSNIKEEQSVTHPVDGYEIQPLYLEAAESFMVVSGAAARALS